MKHILHFTIDKDEPHSIELTAEQFADPRRYRKAIAGQLDIHPALEDRAWEDQTQPPNIDDLLEREFINRNLKIVKRH